MKLESMWPLLSLFCLASGSAPTNTGYIAEFADDLGTPTNSPFFDLGGNVGLGTTTPSATLDVNGSLNAGRITGTSSDVNGVGVSGEANAGTLADGVLGKSFTGNGVHGKSNSSGASGAYGENNAIDQGFGVAGYAAGPNGRGVWGKASGMNGVGVSGQADNGQGANGVLGQSVDGNGVHGQSNSQGASGVYGESNAQTSGHGVSGYAHAPSGIGVWGKSAGWSFHGEGDAHQTPESGGWVKAMIAVDALNHPYRILRCFNSNLRGPAARTPPCGFVFTEDWLGYWRFDFGFRVNDRFSSVTLREVNRQDPTTLIRVLPSFPTMLVVFTSAEPHFNHGTNAMFDLIVY